MSQISAILTKREFPVAMYIREARNVEPLTMDTHLSGKSLFLVAAAPRPFLCAKGGTGKTPLATAAPSV
jgi:hypothetical protein